MFVGERDDRAHWVAAGRACQRFALMATTLGLRHAFVNQPVEVARLRPELAALLVSRVKVMARLDIAEKRVPQDGRISLKVGGR